MRQAFLQAGLGVGTERGHAEAGRFARICRENAWTSSVRDDTDTIAARQRLKIETLCDLEQFVNRVGTYDTRLLKQRRDSRFVRCQACRMAPCCAAA